MRSILLAYSGEPDPLAPVDALAVRAQYGPGVVAGEQVPGYTQEEGVPDDSRTQVVLSTKRLRAPSRTR